MNYYFITGTSRGIGKALADLLLEIEDNFVYGISRAETIKNKNYKHFSIDLSDLEKVKNFNFPEFENADSIVLVNNAVAISEIMHFGKVSNDVIIKDYNISIVAPGILCNNFLKTYQDYSCKRLIVNISSGAAVKPIESWGTYCSSKAALLMLSEVIDVEQKLNHKNNPVHVFSVAPGIVDTDAQVNIRKTKKENFSMVDRFIEFKETNQLSKPGDVARQLYGIIQSPEKYEKVNLDVRNI